MSGRVGMWVLSFAGVVTLVWVLQSEGATGPATAPGISPATVPAGAGEAAAREAAARAQVGRGVARPVVQPVPPVWRGVDLGKAPVSSGSAALPDLWVEVPVGSKSYQIRAEVTVLPGEKFSDPTVYWIKDKNIFYVQWDPMGSSSVAHFYGPFAGDPQKVLAPAASQP